MEVVKKNIKRVYVSGQISGLKIEYAKQNFHFACKEVSKYHEADFVVNPFDITPFLGIKCWSCYMITDLYHLSKCTSIAMQKNWIDSKGCHWEHYFAKFIFKIKVIYL